MKNINKLATLTLAIAITGCSTINYSTNAKTDFFSEPEVGKIVEAYVGDYMLDQGQATTMEYMTIGHLVDGVMYDIPKGSYARIGDYKGTPYFSATNTQGHSIRYAPGIIDAPIALHSKKSNEVCITSVSYQSAACYDAQFKVENRTITDNQSFQQTLIYNGSVGAKINISYREFTDRSARNAFTNNVEYDMKKSKIINYKGARIEVLSYDNTSIKFKVLKHFKSNFSVNH